MMEHDQTINLNLKFIFLISILLSIPITASAQPLSLIKKHKILLDTDFKVIDVVNYSGTTYYIVEYNNLLSYASGIEIISSDGLVRDPELAKSILTQSAYKQALTQLTPSDINTLKEIINTSKKIHDMVSPVASATNFVVDKIDWLKSFCVNVGPVRMCAWDVIKTSYPGITILESELGSLNTKLNEWVDTSKKVSTTLQELINGLEKLNTGGEVDPKLIDSIQTSLSSLKKLKTKIDEITTTLSDVINILSNAERSIYSAAKSASGMPLVGSKIADAISGLGDKVSNLNDKVKSLREDARSFSRVLSEQISKLSNIVNTANEKSEELYTSWNIRRQAPTMVYSTVGGIIAVILVISIVVIYKIKKGKSS